MWQGKAGCKGGTRGGFWAVTPFSHQRGLIPQHRGPTRPRARRKPGGPNFEKLSPRKKRNKKPKKSCSTREDWGGCWSSQSNLFEEGGGGKKQRNTFEEGKKSKNVQIGKILGWADLSAKNNWKEASWIRQFLQKGLDESATGRGHRV